MAIHTFKVSLTMRDESQSETPVIPPIELPLTAESPLEMELSLKSSDLLTTVSFPAAQRNYLMVVAKYKYDDTEAGVKKGDPAPFIMRVNGETVDRLNKGFCILTENVTALQLTTPYDTNKVGFKVVMG